MNEKNHLSKAFHPDGGNATQVRRVAGGQHTKDNVFLNTLLGFPRRTYSSRVALDDNVQPHVRVVKRETSQLLLVLFFRLSWNMNRCGAWGCNIQTVNF